MSGIYIPGMEPPKPDEVIRIYNNGEARKCPLFEQKVIEISVAIPVPEHGRLGDLDALEAKCTDEKGSYFSYEAAIIGEAVSSAPTIIPADKEGEG